MVSVLVFLVLPVHSYYLYQKQMLAYLLILRPFEKTINNALNIYNELVVAFVYIAILIINTQSMTTPSIELTGWMLVVLVLGSLVTTWVILLPGALKELFQAINSCFGSEGEEGGNLGKKEEIPEDSLKTKKKMVKKTRNLRKSPRRAKARFGKSDLMRMRKGRKLESKTSTDIVSIQMNDYQTSVLIL
eukprot:TRINITY_DN239_c0_g1_i1.p12 TRINITY_DN239_c0_g1~~TRINITY_DN239_c0_g1_i1.p12  ORF type:complete len:189 (+),score=17.27 TRINITY_DN239_c0_g1_i1:8326-8892(+)